MPLTAYAGTQTAKTGLAVQALLDNLKRISAEPATDDEVDTRAALPRRRLRGHAWRRSARSPTWSSSLNVLGLPDDYYDVYRKEICARSRRRRRSRPSPSTCARATRSSSVSGDAERIGPVLAHFGEVIVFNPEKEFERVRTIPANPQRAD